MLYGAKTSAIDCPNAFIPALDAAYAGQFGSPRKAPLLDTLTTAPPPAVRRCGIAQKVALAAPVRLVARVCDHVACQSSYDVDSGGWARNTPALLTSTSRRPSRSAAESTAMRTSSGRARSACTSTCPWPASEARTASAFACDLP